MLYNMCDINTFFLLFLNKDCLLLILCFSWIEDVQNKLKLQPALGLGLPLQKPDRVMRKKWTWHLGPGHSRTRSSCEERPPVKPLSTSELVWNAARAFGSNSYSMGKACNVCMMFRWSSNISLACHAMPSDRSASSAVKRAKGLDGGCLLQNEQQASAASHFLCSDRM